MSAPAASLIGALAPGVTLFEYRIERVLGHGGFGITYLAQDTHLDKLVAIKEYLPNELAVRGEGHSVSARSEESQEAFDWGRAQFVKEARVLARFSHPHLIQVHRYFELHGTAYFVMEYAEGTTLAAMLKRKNTLPEDRLLAALLPVIDGLELVHQKGVLHRDIKPDNIILRADGSPVLIDFGAARQNMGAATMSMMSVLTAGYAPLEQYGAAGSQGPWTDVYALGAVAYRILSGKKPIDAVNRIISDPVIPASQLSQGSYTPHFLAAVDWALAVYPEQRPQTIAQWREALEGRRTPPVRAAPSANAGDNSSVAMTPAAVLETAKPASTLEVTEIFKKPIEPASDGVATVIIPRMEAAAVADAAVPAVPAGSNSKAIPAWMKWGLPAGAALLIAVIAAIVLTRPDKTASPAGSPATDAKAAVEAVKPAPSPAKPTIAPAPVATVKSEPAPLTTPKETPLAENKTATKPPRIAKKAADKAAVPAAKSAPEASAAAATPESAAKTKIVPVAKLAARSTFQDCATCPVMTVLPSSSFLMGSKSGAAGAAAWESPQHKVFIAREIAMSWFEITTVEWQQCVEAGVCGAIKAGPSKGDARRVPAVHVSWTDALTYTGWLSEKTGRSYRLPSEAEWEFAIRAGTATSRFWGDDRRGQCDHANAADLSGVKYDSKLPAGQQPCDDGYGALAPTGGFKPNAFSLYDMAGNAWEWTLDCWKDSYAGAPTDGSAVDAPGCTKRVIRGGSWRTKPESLRSANRGLSPAGGRSEDLGFRVVAE